MVVLFCIFGVCKESKQKSPTRKTPKEDVSPYEIFLKRANTFYSALPTLYFKYGSFFLCKQEKGGRTEKHG